jgi:hypothetical protein
VNGVFWTVPVARDSIEMHLGAGKAAFRLSLQIPDDHDLQSSLTRMFPPGFPQMAEVSFEVEWSGIRDRARIRNEPMNFEGEFFQTGSTIRWSSLNPSSGFQFVSEPPNPSRVVNAVIGHERNGIFFR